MVEAQHDPPFCVPLERWHGRIATADLVEVDFHVMAAQGEQATLGMPIHPVRTLREMDLRLDLARVHVHHPAACIVPA